jgi:thiamine-monophosphate kinase
MSEFDMISRYFQPLTMGRERLDNDTASLRVLAGQELVVTTDTLNEGVHFFSDTAPEIIAQKALRSNLSDLTASGAEPLAYTLAIGFERVPDEVWLASFTAALLRDQEIAGIYCCGGDTTSTKGGLSITITAMGLVPGGGAVRRSGAQVGDLAIVTGVIGRGFEAYERETTIAPSLHVGLAGLVQDYAHAAIDISDGLIADVGHIARASGLDIVLRLADVPVVGDSLKAATGGDDYEIVMAVAPEQIETCLEALRAAGFAPAVIGQFEAGRGDVRVIGADGREIFVSNRGWEHF